MTIFRSGSSSIIHFCDTAMYVLRYCHIYCHIVSHYTTTLCSSAQSLRCTGYSTQLCQIKSFSHSSNHPFPFLSSFLFKWLSIAQKMIEMNVPTLRLICNIIYMIFYIEQVVICLFSVRRFLTYNPARDIISILKKSLLLQCRFFDKDKTDLHICEQTDQPVFIISIL